MYSCYWSYDDSTIGLSYLPTVCTMRDYCNCRMLLRQFVQLFNVMQKLIPSQSQLEQMLPINSSDFSATWHFGEQSHYSLVLWLAAPRLLLPVVQICVSTKAKIERQLGGLTRACNYSLPIPLNGTFMRLHSVQVQNDG